MRTHAFIAAVALGLATAGLAHGAPKSADECGAEVDAAAPAAAPRDIRIAQCMLESSKQEAARGEPEPRLRPFKIEKPTAAEIAKIKRELPNHLRDPFSAVLADMYAIRYKGLKDLTVCGTVNAKNAMGAYVGKTLFAFFEDSKDRAFYLAGGKPGDDVMIEAFCKK